MSDETGDTQDAAGVYLDGILYHAPTWGAPEAQAPGDDALVAYLSGALSPEEAHLTERGLVRHAAARRRLPVVAARLEALQAAPWSEVEAAQDTVARAWRSLAARRLETVLHGRKRWVAEGWEAVRTQAAAGVADAQAAWTALLSFADQWGRERRIPRLAEARGPAPVVQSPVPDVTLMMEAKIGESGDLTGHVQARETDGRTSAALDGRTVRLALSAGGDAWPLAAGEMRDGKAAWHLPGAGNALGLSPGPLAGLIVTFDETPTAPEAVRFLFAGDAGARVELWGTPRREAGRLRLTLALPALTRAAQAGRRLVMSAAVTPGLYQRLGAWPISDWEDAPRTVEASCPGPDSEFDTAALRLDLEPIPD